MNLFNLTCFLWISFEIILNRLLRSGKSDKKSADKNTVLFIWMVIIASMTIGVFVSTMSVFPIIFNAHLELIGALVIVLGAVIRTTAILQLGRFFTVDVTIRKDHRLKQTGLYRFLRHPSYAGALLSFLGFGIALNNWFSLIIAFLPVLFIFIHRMNIEEKVLLEQFGKQYADYIDKTKRIIPFIY